MESSVGARERSQCGSGAVDADCCLKLYFETPVFKQAPTPNNRFKRLKLEFGGVACVARISSN